MGSCAGEDDASPRAKETLAVIDVELREKRRDKNEVDGDQGVPGDVMGCFRDEQRNAMVG